MSYGIKLLLLILSLFQAPMGGVTGGGSAGPSFSLVQKTANSSTSSSTPISLSLTGTAAHDIIVVGVSQDVSSGGSFSVSDGANGFYTAVETFACNNGVRNAQFFYVLNNAGGNLTISVSSTYIIAFSSLWANAREYHSTTTASLDQGACISSFPSTTTPVTPSITTTGNSLVLANLYSLGASSGTCGSGWTTNCSTNTNQVAAGATMVEDKLNQAAGAISATFGLSPAQTDYAGAIFNFKD